MPPKNARLQGKKFLLTYPKCTLTKEEVRDFLLDQKGVDQFTIAKELHQNGDPHIHACVLLQSSPRTTDMRWFDIAGFHPNIKTLPKMSDFKAATKYVRKDGDFITNVEEPLSPMAALFQALLNNPGGLTKSFVRANPRIMGLNWNVLQQWLRFMRPELYIPVPRILPKRRNSLYTGPANSGKTYRSRAVISMYHFPSEIPRNNDYSGIDVDTDLLFCDEYDGFLSIQQINRLCDGCTKLNTKGGSTTISHPVIILISNFTFEQIYPLATKVEMDSLYARFDQYVFPINLPKFPTCEL